MKISIIPSDKTIVKDGVAVDLSFEGATAFPTTNSDYHAIQWDNNTGFIEKISNCEQEMFTDVSTIQPYIDAHTTEVARLEALITEEQPSE